MDLRVFGSAAEIYHALKRVADKVIEPGRRFRLLHRLRDSFGTKLADNGVPLDRIQTLMGHKDIGMTRKYVETREAGLKDAIADTFNG